MKLVTLAKTSVGHIQLYFFGPVRHLKMGDESGLYLMDEIIGLKYKMSTYIRCIQNEWINV